MQMLCLRFTLRSSPPNDGLSLSLKPLKANHLHLEEIRMIIKLKKHNINNKLKNVIKPLGEECSSKDIFNVLKFN